MQKKFIINYYSREKRRKKYSKNNKVYYKSKNIKYEYIIVEGKSRITL